MTKNAKNNSRRGITWYKLFNKIGKQTIKKTQNTVVQVLIDGQLRDCKLTFANGQTFYLEPVEDKPDVSVRPLSKKESQEAVRKFYSEVYKELPNKTFWLPEEGDVLKHYGDEFWSLFWGAFDGEKMVGAVGIFLTGAKLDKNKELADIAGEDAVEVGRLAVHPDYRNRGIAKKLLKEILNFAGNSAYDFAVCTVHPDNDASKRTLKDIGFVKVADTVKYLYDIENEEFVDYPRDIMRINLKKKEKEE